jgi:hypothetical protein
MSSLIEFCVLFVIQNLIKQFKYSLIFSQTLNIHNISIRQLCLNERLFFNKNNPILRNQSTLDFSFKTYSENKNKSILRSFGTLKMMFNRLKGVEVRASVYIIKMVGIVHNSNSSV